MFLGYIIITIIIINNNSGCGASRVADRSSAAWISFRSLWETTKDEVLKRTQL
jgi:hypothetical protein